MATPATDCIGVEAYLARLHQGDNVADELHRNRNIPVIMSLLDVAKLAQENAVAALRYLACGADGGDEIYRANRHAICAAGGVDKLVQLINVPWAWSNATRTLGAFGPDGTIADNTQVITKFVELLDVPEAQYYVLRALSKFALHGSTKRIFFEKGGTRKLVDLLDTDTQNKWFVIQALQTMANKDRTNQNAIRKLGGIPKLVALIAKLSYNCIEYTAQAAAARIFITLAEGNPDNHAAICKAGAIPKLVARMDSCDPHDVRISAALALESLVKFGNSFCTETLLAIHAAGGVEKLTKLMKHDQPATTSLFLLSELAKQGYSIRHSIRTSGAIPKLVAFITPYKQSVLRVLNYTDFIPDVVALLDIPAAQSDAAEALSGLARSNRDNQDAVLDAGGIPKLVALLEVQDAQRKAVDALAELASANIANKDAIREAEGIPKLVALLETHSAWSGVAEVFTALADENRENQDDIRTFGGIPKLVALLEESPARSGAAGALSELARCNSYNQDAVREAGGIPKLVALLEVQEAQMKAADALAELARDNSANRDAIRETECIPKLVALVDLSLDYDAASAALYELASDNIAGVHTIVALLDVPETQVKAMCAICALTWTDFDSDAIRRAGGIPKLVALLDVQVTRDNAANVLRDLAANVSTKAAIVDQMCAAATVHVPSQFTDAVRARREEIRRADRRSKYEAEGADFTPSDDFLCPITMQVMLDPVVASDGHSYERMAIQRVLDSTSISPMTRERLETYVTPNLVLRSLIQNHEDAVIRAHDASVLGKRARTAE